jgi:mono/diheme cytochrome c family protein
MSYKPIFLFLSILLWTSTTAQAQISPTAASLGPNQQQQFSMPGQLVKWAVVPAQNGTISATGLYTAPSAVPAATYALVYAESGTALYHVQVLLSPSVAPAAPPAVPVSVTLSPATVYLYGGQSQTFTATVTGSANQQVSWSITQGTGVIANGLYHAPATVVADTLVTISATSLADPTKTASATIMLGPAITAPTTTTSGSTTASGSTTTGSSAASGSTTTGSPAASGSTTTGSSTGSSSTGTSTSTSFTPIRVACGEGQYVDPQGLVWAADHGYSGTTATYTTGSAVSGTTTPGLYQYLRYGQNFQYSFPVPTGTYTVTLKFAEISFGTAGRRVFDVAINNQSVITNLDIFAQAGGKYRALDESFTVPATNGITISFSASVNDAQINGIQILQTTNSPSAVSIGLSPPSATLSAGGSAQFAATVSGGSNTAVTWSLSSSVGSVASGLYTAPATISAAQSITITATSVADPTMSAAATINLQASPLPTSVSPATASVAPSGTRQFSVQNLPSGASVAWAVSPATGSISQSGLYTAPSSVTAQTTITVTATNSSTKSVLGTASLTLTATPAATTITLPIEVVGPNGTTATASFTIPAGSNLSGQLQLWMQIHNLKYDTEGSVQVNSSAWLPISTANVTLLGNAAVFGGIGGGFHTLQMTLNLPAGVVTAGTNTITFRFNATDGVTSGFRVLAFNVQSAGSNLLPASLFVNDNPNNWQPPSTAASDIAAGLALYQGASLTSPSTGVPIQAHCSDCHTIDGRDLKYFNYSNNSIQARAVFHGLTAAQGNQIASYIRSLDLPNPGLPWNPPYQPGPGLDSQAVSNWSAGAGIDAVLDNDSQMEAYLAPGGSTAGWSASSYLNPRELPVVMQLPDWNSWLPVIHPKDAFGTTFTNNALYTGYLNLRNILQPNSATAYQNALYPFDDWFESDSTFFAAIETTASATEVYSVALWQMTKEWELNQEFGLEGMPQVPFGAKADVRGWFGQQAFGTAPNMLKIPAGPGIGNGTVIVRDYLTLVWYQLQMVLNDGQGTQSGHTPLDYGYVYGYIDNVFVKEAVLPGAMLQLEWLVKSLQEFTQGGTGPQVAGDLGWHPVATSPMVLVDWSGAPLWSATPAATQTALMQAYLQAWFNQASQYTPQQYYQGGWATATDNPATLFYSETFGGQVWYMLPRFRFQGVSATLTDQVAAWAATVWPLGDWKSNDSATCTSLLECTSGY